MKKRVGDTRNYETPLVPIGIGFLREQHVRPPGEIKGRAQLNELI